MSQKQPDIIIVGDGEHPARHAATTASDDSRLVFIIENTSQVRIRDLAIELLEESRRRRLSDRGPVDDSQPRYTTKRMYDEVAKAKAYARCEALEEAAALVESRYSDAAAAIRDLVKSSKEDLK
ncbi:hypothetical protein G6L37_34770 [Agrobacterium rubi]|nr:hypothetical protein [Agrobacterium rubi]NTF23732.1 hypothetical protein [Agrobacterium rubi]